MVRKLLLLTSLCTLTWTVSAQDKEKEKSLNLFGDNTAKGPTVVTASKEANFDSQNHVAVFVGDVQVQDPQFSMTCDKLTVQLNKEQGGLKQANADGNVFIVSVQKSKDGGPDEKSTGKGDRAVYTTEDGRIALYGSPQIQQGGTTHVGTDPSTQMFLWKDGRMQTKGPSKTVLSSTPKENKAPK
ncbi:MAG TPA: LptA/OstA family protein [Chthoniobacterales bacterium]|jgi:lipopolysaccharide transport protein LptA